MKYQLAIFDLDGTLLDTLDDLADSVNYALEEAHLPRRTKEEVRTFVGNGIRKLIERSVPEGTDKHMTDSVHETFLDRYKGHCADKTRPYDGIPELLEQLKAYGIECAVVSNKADAAVKELCETYFPGVFAVTVGERAGIARKPAPDTVNEVLAQLYMEKTQAVYIGDSEVDVETAKNAGMDVVAVDWGFRDAKVLKEAGAKVIVSEPEALADALIKSSFCRNI